MLTFIHIFYASAVILVLLAIAYLVVIYRISKGKTLTDQAQHVIKLEHFHQTHPAVQRLADQSRRWRLILTMAMLAAILLPFLWLAFLPNLGSTTGVLVLIALLAICVTSAAGIHFTLDSRLRKVYRQHDLLFRRIPHLRAFLLTYQAVMLIFIYEVLGLASIYAILYF
ncbi:MULTISPECIES: hypothetical protein [Lactobacillaceae]|uniref:hypothetical protein n=1 Tax=Lactobacillaceae TaxID=33958 RepID=UPI001457623E|nr:hypothetical protein [Lactobacillus sp. HBUAS51381]NLR09143.1 hypothetical protein [Lactobacillus sp. HBUAS51381]